MRARDRNRVGRIGCGNVIVTRSRSYIRNSRRSQKDGIISAASRNSSKRKFCQENKIVAFKSFEAIKSVQWRSESIFEERADNDFDALNAIKSLTMSDALKKVDIDRSRRKVIE